MGTIVGMSGTARGAAATNVWSAPSWYHPDEELIDCTDASHIGLSGVVGTNMVWAYQSHLGTKYWAYSQCVGSRHIFTNASLAGAVITKATLTFNVTASIWNFGETDVSFDIVALTSTTTDPDELYPLIMSAPALATKTFTMSPDPVTGNDSQYFAAVSVELDCTDLETTGTSVVIGYRDNGGYAKKVDTAYVTSTFALTGISLTVEYNEVPDAPSNVQATCGAVPDRIPHADFSADKYTAAVGQNVHFTDLSDNSPTSWLWTFGREGSSAVQDATFAFSEVGVHLVSLAATNVAGTGTRTKIITIESVEDYQWGEPQSGSGPEILIPEASFTADAYKGTAPITINFTNTSQNYTTSSWMVAPATAEGQVDDRDYAEFATTSNTSREFVSDGIYSVKLTVGDGVFETSASVLIYIGSAYTNIPVITSMTATPSSGAVPFTVQFSATVTPSADTYSWYIPNYGGGPVGMTGQTPSFKFEKPGTYEVILTVTNTWGSSWRMIMVTAAAMSLATINSNSLGFIGAQEIGYYIVDTVRHRVLIYEKNNTFIASFGTFGMTEGRFVLPTKLAINGGLKLLTRSELVAGYRIKPN